MRTIIREVPAEQMELSYYFDDDGLTEASGDFNNTLFIVAQATRISGFNEEAYNEVISEIERLEEDYADFTENKDYTDFTSLKDVLMSNKLVDDASESGITESFESFLKRNYARDEEQKTADFLTLKTGKKWEVSSASGYSQGDYVKMVYCTECYKTGVTNYGEIWLGACKEFYTIEIDENGEEGDTCGGLIVADCQARTDEDYKRIVCEYAELKEEETVLEMIESERIVKKYEYRTI